MDYAQLGKKIHDERIKKQLTQEQLAELAEVTSSYIGQIERNERKPGLTKVEKMADILGVTVDYLIGFKPNKEIIETEKKIEFLVKTLGEKDKRIVLEIIQIIKKNN